MARRSRHLSSWPPAATVYLVTRADETAKVTLDFIARHGHYQDNPGLFSVTANLLAEPAGAPESATLVLLALGLAGLTFGRLKPRPACS